MSEPRNCPRCGKLRRQLGPHLLWCQCDDCPYRRTPAEATGDIPSGCDMGYWEGTGDCRARGRPPAYPCMDREAALEGVEARNDDVTPEVDFEDTAWMRDDDYDGGD